MRSAADPPAKARLSMVAESTVYQHARELAPLETGGLLFGTVERDPLGNVARYRVTRATVAPEDSIHGPGSFTLGGINVDDSITIARAQGLLYLGEWHSHPGHACDPSRDDGLALRQIADGTDVPPVMLIVGRRFTERMDWAWFVQAEGADPSLLRRIA